MKAFLLIPVFVLVFEAGQIRGAIEGFVTRAGTADPVTGASVVLAGAGTVVRTATDLSGYFRFDNLVADHYKLDVSREGYFARSADGAILRVQSQPLELQDQNVQFVAVSLHKLGEIAGYVSDSNGRAVSDVRVQAMRLGHEGGQLVLESGRSTRSNLEGYPGQYLIPALDPGEYHVGITNSAGIVFDSLVHVEEGRRTIVDFRIPAVETFTISGTLVSPGTLADSAAVFYVTPRDWKADVNPEPRVIPIHGARFEISGLAPGGYDVFTFLAKADTHFFSVFGGIQSTPQQVGIASVNVVDHDIRDVTIRVGYPVATSGRILMTDSDARSTSLAGMIVELRPRLNLRHAVFANLIMIGSAKDSTLNATSKRDGSFTVPDVFPGFYNVALSNPPGDAYIADLRQSGRSLLDDGYRVGLEPPALLDVIVNANGGAVEGIVRNAAGQRTRAVVSLVPQRRQRTLYYKTIQTSDGAFSFHGVAPGEYKLFAWDSIVPGAEKNPEFLRKHEDLGVLVNIGSAVRVELPLNSIPTLYAAPQ